MKEYYSSRGGYDNVSEGIDYTKSILEECNSLYTLGEKEKERIGILWKTDPKCLNKMPGSIRNFAQKEEHIIDIIRREPGRNGRQYIDLSILYNIKPDGAVKLLSWMMANMQSLTNEVLITPQRREQICKELGISQAVYYVYLNSLLDSKVIAGKRGNYIIDPELAWYGNTKQRERI